MALRLINLSEHRFISPSEYDRLIQDGWSSRTERTTRLGENQYDLQEYTKSISCPQRIARVTCYFFAALPCCWLFPGLSDRVDATYGCCVPDFTERCCRGPCRGEEILSRYVMNPEKTEEMYRKDEEKLGFSHQDKIAMRTYMDTHDQEVQKHKGHEFLCYKTTKSELAYVLFAPYGDRNDIRRYPLGDPALKSGFGYDSEQGRLGSSVTPYTDLVKRAKKICEKFQEPKEAKSTEATPLLTSPTNDLIVQQPT